MKRLMPSLRAKKRYVAFETASEGSLELQPVKKSVWDVMLRLFGEMGSAKIDAHFVDEQWKDGKGIVRCSPKGIDGLLASFAAVSLVNGKKTIIRSLGVSGTIKGAKRFL